MPSPILAHLAVRIHVFLKYQETLRELCEYKAWFCFIMQCIQCILRLQRYFVSILKLAIGGPTSESFRELLNHTEILGKRKTEGKELKVPAPKPNPSI